MELEQVANEIDALKSRVKELENDHGKIKSAASELPDRRNFQHHNRDMIEGALKAIDELKQTMDNIQMRLGMGKETVDPSGQRYVDGVAIDDPGWPDVPVDELTEFQLVEAFADPRCHWWTVATLEDRQRLIDAIRPILKKTLVGAMCVNLKGKGDDND